MLVPWNDSRILPPPVLTSSSQSSEDAQGLLHACQDMQKVLTNQSPLHKEAALLSRMVYKYDKKFRNDIGYKNFKKVNTALHKYLRLNFLKDIEQFQSVLPSQDADDDIYMPSRQMLEYLLVRLQTFSKIILRIYICSKCAATFYLDRIKKGESHWMSLMPYAVLARIWSMSWVLIRHSCKWYKSLIAFQSNLQSKGIPFLPENYKLPSDLGEWLDIDNVDDIGRHNWSEVKSVTVLPFLEEVDEQETSFDIFNYVSDINSDNKAEIDPTPSDLQKLNEEQTLNRNKIFKPLGNSNDKKEDLGKEVIKKECKEKKQPKTFTQLLNQNLDLGQTISRKSFNIEKPKKETDKPKKETDKPEVQENSKAHTIHCITDSQTLTQFLDLEELYRNNGSNNALTNHLSFMQWQALKCNLMQLCDSTANNRKIQRKLQKIWKQKCLAYL